MLLLENDLTKAIKDLLLTETKLRIAVAFIGDGATQLINPNANDVQIICNLTMGGTNPKEVRKLIKKYGKNNVRQVDNLHAKLYIGAEYAIVGSANMSANGLGTQPNALREAGYQFKLGQPSGKRSIDWFDVQWKEAHLITNDDLKNAEDKWKRRDPVRNGEPDSKDICDYDFDRAGFPLLEWIESRNYDLVGNTEIDDSLFGGWDAIGDAATNGVGIECTTDINHLHKDRWILRFIRRRNAELSWIQLSGSILKNVYILEGNNKPTSVAVIKNGFNSGPFKIDVNFVDEFRNLLFVSDKYPDLIDNNYEGCWYHPRIERMRDFWKELQLILCKKNKPVVFREE